MSHDHREWWIPNRYQTALPLAATAPGRRRRRTLIRFRQRKRDVLARIRAPADRDDDVLLAVQHVGHRRAALRGRNEYRTDLLSVRLVVGPQHRAARMLRCRGHQRIA